MRRLGLACLPPIVGALLGCAEPSARPPGVQGRCDGSPSCGIAPPVPGGGADAGAAETGTPASVQVDIKELVQDTVLRNAQPFQGKVVISALDSEGVPLSEEYDTTAAANKNLELLRGTSVWVTVTPLSSVAGSRALVTLQNVDTSQFTYPDPPYLTLYVASVDLVAGILSGLVPSQTTDLNAAQVLVYFVDSGGIGVEDVAVTLLTETPILYTEGGVWGTFDRTDTSGQVLLANVPIFDGGFASLSYTVNGATASDAGDFAPVTFPVGVGAVTLLTIVVR